MTIIYIHAFLALLAIPVGWYIFLTTKGTPRHRLMGRIWVLLLSSVAITALSITTINPGHYSVIHLLIPYTLGSLVYSLWNIRKFKQTKIPKYKRAHMNSMIGVYRRTINCWCIYFNARQVFS
jgi:uncharacterized membrane protein